MKIKENLLKGELISNPEKVIDEETKPVAKEKEEIPQELVA